MKIKLYGVIQKTHLTYLLELIFTLKMKVGFGLQATGAFILKKEK
jgi:hypothetical protein